MKKISGVGRRHILKSFFKRINTPYDLHIINAIDGEEMLHLALTKKSVYIMISSFLVLSFLVVSLIFLFTPIKYYIPGYETDASRKKPVQLQAKIDALEAEQNSFDNIRYNILAVLNDNEKILLDTVQLTDKQLSYAELTNEQLIETDIGKQKAIVSKSKDSVSLENQLPSKAGKLEKESMPIPAQQRKKDTIITYR